MLEALRPILGAREMTVAVVDVDADPELEAAYGDRVPVLLLGAPPGGIELCHFRLDRARVEAALAESPQARAGIASGTEIR